MQVEILDEDFMLHILNNIPQRAYETTIELCEEELSCDTLTLANLKLRLTAKYRRNQRSKEDANDVALFATKQFKGMCNVCGKIGHKGPDCFTLPQNAKKKEQWQANLNKRKGNKKGNSNHSNHNNHNNNNKTGVVCLGCGKPGHIKPNCPDKHKNESVAAAVTEDMILLSSTIDFQHVSDIAVPAMSSDKLLPTTWIADSGATVHITNSPSGFENCTPSNKEIIVGNGLSMKVKQIGDWSGKIKGGDGALHNVTLTNVHFIPEAICNLFSLTSVMTKGWKLSGDQSGICIQKGDKKIMFEQKIKSPKGTIFGAEIQPSIEMANPAKDAVKMTYKEAHGKLTHSGKDLIKHTAHVYGWQLTYDIDGTNHI
jgi:hypothetical protein